MAALIETTGCRLRGIRSGPVEAFLGIPYAMPPAPPHRFMAPHSTGALGWRARRRSFRLAGASIAIPVS